MLSNFPAKTEVGQRSGADWLGGKELGDPIGWRHLTASSCQSKDATVTLKSLTAPTILSPMEGIGCTMD